MNEDPKMDALSADRYVVLHVNHSTLDFEENLTQYFEVEINSELNFISENKNSQQLGSIQQAGTYL